MDTNIRNALILSTILMILTAAFMWVCNFMLGIFFAEVKHGEAELQMEAREKRKPNCVEIEPAEECIA